MRLRYQPPGGSTSTLMETDVPAVADPGTASRDTSWALAMAGFAKMLGDESRESCDWRTVRRVAEAGQSGAEAEARADALDLVDKASRFER